MSAPSLELLGFSKRFGGLMALDDASVKIAAGAFHALLGENGAGKSTLVKCAMGYYAADVGEILLNGRQVTIGHPREAHQLGLGIRSALIVHPAQSAPLGAERIVDLAEMPDQAMRRKLALAECAREKTAIVAIVP